MEKKKKLNLELKRIGLENHSHAYYFNLLCEICNKTKHKYFLSNINMKDRYVDKIAAKLVYEFLKREKLNLTLNTIKEEFPSDLFSNNNTESILPLDFRQNRPLIQKLTKQRYVSPNKSVLNPTGWLMIDSDDEITLTNDDSGSTFGLNSNISLDSQVLSTISDISSLHSQQKSIQSSNLSESSNLAHQGSTIESKKGRRLKK